MLQPSFIANTTVAIAAISAAVLFTGCQSSTGPWARQPYERPSGETPVNEVVVTPGAPLPFEQRLPAGNVRAANGFNARN